jgi:hypothetical protein
MNDDIGAKLRISHNAKRQVLAQPGLHHLLLIADSRRAHTTTLHHGASRLNLCASRKPTARSSAPSSRDLCPQKRLPLIARSGRSCLLPTRQSAFIVYTRTSSSSYQAHCQPTPLLTHNSSISTIVSMADDGELAFLNAQKEDEYDPSTNYTPTGEEEYDPATTYSPHAPSDESASMPESAGNTPPPAEDEGVNGASLQPAPVSAEVSAAPTPSKQPRTRGGFVDDSEDEEEEPVAQPMAAASALLRAISPEHSFTNTPSNTVPTTDVQLHSAQDQGAPSLLSASVAVNESAPSAASSVPNGYTPVPDATKLAAPAEVNAASRPQSIAPVTTVPPSAALPKARLPQDRIGILDDRIAEDPRGDIEAWLSLIDEYRRRHKYDDARDVIERFLKTFPTAVSNIGYCETNLADMSRVSNGSSMSRSRPNSTNCQGWKPSSANPSCWRPTSRCILRTSTSSGGGTACSMTRPVRTDRSSPKLTSSYSSR